MKLFIRGKNWFLAHWLKLANTLAYNQLLLLFCFVLCFLSLSAVQWQVGHMSNLLTIPNFDSNNKWVRLCMFLCVRVLNSVQDMKFQMRRKRIMLYVDPLASRFCFFVSSFEKRFQFIIGMSLHILSQKVQAWIKICLHATQMPIRTTYSMCPVCCYLDTMWLDRVRVPITVLQSLYSRWAGQHVGFHKCLLLGIFNGLFSSVWGWRSFLGRCYYTLINVFVFVQHCCVDRAYARIVSLCTSDLRWALCNVPSSIPVRDFCHVSFSLLSVLMFCACPSCQLSQKKKKKKA